MTALTIISHDNIEAIHAATLRILHETGVILTHPEAVDLLTAHGARVDGSRVYLPPDVVEAALARTPETVALRGRAGLPITLGDGALHWHNMGGARDMFDLASGQVRGALLEDVRQSTMVLDALEHVSSLTTLVTPRDVPDHMMALAMYRHTLPHTTKFVHGSGVTNGKEVDFIVKMAEVIGPPQEVLSLPVSPVSPLTFPDDLVDAMLAIARRGIPFWPLPSPTVGTTAPMTLAGALAQQNAENIAAIVLTQLAHPGLPVVYSGRLAVLEPRTGASIWGAVELGMVSAATVQLGHRYRLPVNVYGFATNAYTYDIQSGYERALNAILPALAGADELSGIGGMGAVVISSLTQLVLDNEIAASVKKARQGFAVNSDTLAVDVIHNVMQRTRNFMGERHTVKHLRTGEISYPRLAERRGLQEWDRDKRRGMVERAGAEVQRILAEHQAPPLTPEQEKTLDAIMAAADRELAVR